MCKCECEHPELRPENGKCSGQQIKECHGDEKEHLCHSEDHPCETESKK